jgi:hypothetical protein
MGLSAITASFALQAKIGGRAGLSHPNYFGHERSIGGGNGALPCTYWVDLAAARAKRRVFCRPCLDWTERRPHIGGAVGAAVAKRCFDLKWIEQVRDSRALAITPAGHRGLVEAFGLSV